MSATRLPAFTPRNFECTACQKRFSKAEHLMRHEKIHSGSKPFSCSDCRRQFARQDSLARHVKLHRRPSQLPASTAEDVPEQINALEAEVPPSSSNGGHASYSHASGTPMQTALEPGSGDISAPQNASENSAMSISASTDADVHLTWPDSEDLLQRIMSADLESWQQPMEALPLPQYSAHYPNIDQFYQTQDLVQVEEASPAVRSLSQMIAAKSASVTAEVESTGITSQFLDGCLHMFFAKFNPSLPVLHRGTFVYRDCTHPLLLNAIALGSLFLGPKDAISKGEALWRLAHTAVATSWQSMINHHGPYDTCKGIQLVQTALLGQIYAILSKNHSIRMTAQIFHSLGFYWARHCGMYNLADFGVQDIPSPDATLQEKDHRWKVWAARELQARALLAHYVLDGQISQVSGHPTCARHTTNPLGLPSSENVFSAENAEDWITRMETFQYKQHPESFLDLFREIFDAKDSDSRLDLELTGFSLHVVLEGLRSLVIENNLAGACAVGSPTKQQIHHAMGQTYNHIISSLALSKISQSEALLRFHAISLDAAVNSNWLCSTICQQFGIIQNVLSSSSKKNSTFNIQQWSFSTEARLALLHANAIHEIATEVPLGHAHAIHIPGSLFVAATVYCAFLLAGSTTVSVPKEVDWREIMFMHMYSTNGNDMVGPPERIGSSCKEFLRGSLQPPMGVTKNLLYELNLLQIHLRCLSQQWGICSEMDNVLDQWILLCT